MTGRKAEVEDKATVLHRGIATRAFERRFQLADHVRAVEAVTENGLLHIDLVREVPEALKPRKIEIARGQGDREPGRGGVSRSHPRNGEGRDGDVAAFFVARLQARWSRVIGCSRTSTGVPAAL